MAMIQTFIMKVRKDGRVTIPEPIRIAQDIQEQDIMYFAVSDQPFRAETVLQ